jgi:hypothetical protein
MLKAAEYWAMAGTGAASRLPTPLWISDTILAAQAAVPARDSGQTVIATTNVRHFALFSPARSWREIV